MCQERGFPSTQIRVRNWEEDSGYHRIWARRTLGGMRRLCGEGGEGFDTVLSQRGDSLGFKREIEKAGRRTLSTGFNLERSQNVFLLEGGSVKLGKVTSSRTS